MAEERRLMAVEDIEAATFRTEQGASWLVVDPGNRTDTPLPAFGVWDGGPVDVSGFSLIQAVWDTDAPGTIFFVTCHDDGSDWRAFPLLVAGDGFDASFTSPRSKMFRLRLVNGDKAQSYLRVRLILSPQAFQLPMSAMRNTPSGKTLSLPTRSVLFGWRDDINAPGPVKVNAAGAIPVEIPKLPLNAAGTALRVESMGPTIQYVRGVAVTTAAFTVTWPTPFVDDKYAVTFGLNGGTTSAPAPRVTAKTAATVTIAVTSPAAGFTLDVIGVR